MTGTRGMFAGVVGLAMLAGGARADFSYAFVFGETTDISTVGSAAYDPVNYWSYVLTDGDDQAGALWHTSKQQVANGFHTIFSFRIFPSSILGDGLAFVIQNDENATAALGSGGSGLGYEGIASGLAIEFDTFSFGGSEPDALHVAVHSSGNDPLNAGAESTLAVAQLPFDLDFLYSNNIDVAVTYLPADGDDPARLEVWVEEQLLIDLEVDLTNMTNNGLDGASIVGANGDMYFGFTASTGLADSTHLLTSWTVRENTGTGCIEPQWHLASWGTGFDGTEYSFNTEVVVSGSRPLAFEWFKDDVLMSDDPPRLTGTATPTVRIYPALIPDDFGYYRVTASNGCGSVALDNFMQFRVEGICNDIDFNNDGLFPDDSDLIAFLSVLAGGSCDTSLCDPIDFNNDGLFPDDSDLATFLNVLAGGTCVP